MKLAYLAGRFSPTKAELRELRYKFYGTSDPNVRKDKLVEAAINLKITEIINRNIANAVHASALLAIAGEGRYGVVCPHAAFAPIWSKIKEIAPDSDLCAPDSDFWYKSSLALLESCEGIVMLPGWEESIGAVRERDSAYNDGKPIERMRSITLPLAQIIIAKFDKVLNG